MWMKNPGNLDRIGMASACLALALYSSKAVGQTESPSKSTFSPGPAAKTLSIATSKGVVVVRNFYSNPVEISPDKLSVLIERKPSHDIVFFVPDRSFSIAISKRPFSASRKLAERAFLKSLQINERDACKLKVTLGVPFSVDASRSGKDYGLSFCEGSLR